MARCESDDEYEIMWLELNKAIIDEPFLPKRFRTEEENKDIDWKLTHELQMLITVKDRELEEVLIESRVGTSSLGTRGAKKPETHLGSREASKPVSHLTPIQTKRTKPSKKSTTKKGSSSSKARVPSETRTPHLNQELKRNKKAHRNKYEDVATNLSYISSLSYIDKINKNNNNSNNNNSNNNNNNNNNNKHNNNNNKNNKNNNNNSSIPDGANIADSNIIAYDFDDDDFDNGD